MNLEIRKANKDDTKKIQVFRNEEWHKFQKENNYLWKEKEYSLIAFIGKNIVGLIRFRIVGGAGEFKEVIVSKEFRKKGIGHLLFEKAENFMKDKKCHVAYGETDKNNIVNFLKHQGYTETAKLKNNRFHLPVYFLEKRLK